MSDTSTVRPPRHHSRATTYRAAVIVVATTALTTATLGIAAPAGAAPDPGPGPGVNPAYTTSTFPVAGTPDRVAIDESTHTAYVTNPKSAPQNTVPDNGTVSVINLNTNQVTRTIAVGINPFGIAVDPSTHRVYVANRGTSDIIGTPIGNNVSVIDPTNNFETSTATVPGYPQAVAVDPDTHRVYVVHQSAELGTFDGVSVLDPGSSTFGDTIRFGDFNGPHLGAPRRIAIADGSAYVTGTYFDDGTAPRDVLAAINLDTKDVTYIPVGSNAFGVAVDPITDRTYVTQGRTNANGIKIDNGVGIVDTTTNTYLGTILTGGFPILVAVDSAAHTAYVTNSNGTVAVIDTTTSQLAGTVTVADTPTIFGEPPAGPYPTGVAVDQVTHKVYLANGQGVVVLDRNGNTEPTTPSIGAINPTVSTNNGLSVLFATVAPGTPAGSVAFSDGGAVIDRCDSRPIVFGYALCFTSFATGGDHAITVNYFGDNTHAPSSGSVPVAVNAQPDDFQNFVGQFIRVARFILGALVPAEDLDFGF